MINFVGKRVSNPDNYIDLKRKYSVLLNILTLDSLLHTLKVDEHFLADLLSVKPQFFDKYKMSDENKFDNIIHLKDFDKS